MRRPRTWWRPSTSRRRRALLSSCLVLTFQSTIHSLPSPSLPTRARQSLTRSLLARPSSPPPSRFLGVTFSPAFCSLSLSWGLWRPCGASGDGDGDSSSSALYGVVARAFDEEALFHSHPVVEHEVIKRAKAGNLLFDENPSR